ncbi:hypothetical protein CASFOL_003525 [Castilleja foliolosa]|uniref:Uncharacterized protein n=1 Tax=Castilleja foliolosa TaxID=1961234 RepID=A0ABD3EKT0_9LAMI
MLEDDTLVVYKPEDTIRFYKDGRVLRINSVRKYQYHKTPYVYFESLISPHTCLHVEEVNQKIVPNGFFETTSHLSDTMPENAFVATKFSATTNRGKHAVTKKTVAKILFATTLFL